MRRVLLVSQVYVPDPASVGQQLADVAEEMSRRGWSVSVITSRRGHDNPALVYSPSEVLNGVRVVRIPSWRFGREPMGGRLAAGLWFCLWAFARAMVARRVDLLLVTTAPPMASAIAVALHVLRDWPVAYYVMDINPDEAVLTGLVPKDAVQVRMLEAANRSLLGRARTIITLDKQMASRLKAQCAQASPIVVSPWPVIDETASGEEAAQPDTAFIRSQGLAGRRLFMYCGNISPVHPVEPLLLAAERLRDEHNALFVFVGGGRGVAQLNDLVSSRGLTNVKVFPYQPLERLRDLLSSADVHLVTMGLDMAGIVHPSKVYGALAVGRPVVAVGPSGSCISEVLDQGAVGWTFDPHDVDGLTARLSELARLPQDVLRGLGQPNRVLVRERFSRGRLCAQVCDALEG